MTQSTGGSGLFYYGTKEEVRIGDRVHIKRLLLKDIEGTVCYIPGISPPHSELGDDQWAVRADDGTIWAKGYDPKDRFSQPGPKYCLLSRGEGGEVKPDEIIDESQISDKYQNDDEQQI